MIDSHEASHSVPSGLVVVGVDGSAASDAAVRFGSREALRLGAGLRLVHVSADYLPGHPYAVTLDDVPPTGRKMLRRAAETALDECPTIELSSSLLYGPRVEALLSAAEGARFVVLGHDPRLHLMRLATGSTVIGVAARAASPVVAIQPAWTSGTHRVVTVGIKAVGRSAQLLRRAFHLAAEQDCELIVAHAWQTAPGSRAVAPTAAERATRSRSAVETLAHAAESAARLYPSVRYEIRVDHGPPADILEGLSERSDLMVLARRGHALPRGHLGPTARALLRTSACPIVFLPPADEPVALPSA